MHWVVDGKILRGFHTQEFRPKSQPLTKPIKCIYNTWLGIGFYFWVEEEFAHYWGEDFKRGHSGYYDIYEANLDVSNCLNAVFNEDDYNLFIESIETVIARFETLGQSVTLDKVNRYLSDYIWPTENITGIIYDDKPVNSSKSGRVYSKIPNLYYKKRIQIVIFDLQYVNNFDVYKEEQ